MTILDGMTCFNSFYWAVAPLGLMQLPFFSLFVRAILSSSAFKFWDMCSFCCYSVIMSSNIKRSNILMCFVPAALQSGKVWSEAGSPTRISASCWSKPIGGKPYQPSTSTLPRWTIKAKPMRAHKCTKKVAHIICALYSKSSKAWKSSPYLHSNLIWFKFGISRLFWRQWYFTMGQERRFGANTSLNFCLFLMLKQLYGLRNIVIIFN